MGMKEVAVEKTLKIEVSPPATGKVSIISPPSPLTKVEGNAVYRGPLQFSVSNVQLGSMGTAKPGTLPIGVIPPTAKVTKVDHLAVIRVGDKISGLLAADAMMPSAPSPVPSPITFGVEIKDAGQTKFKGE